MSLRCSICTHDELQAIGQAVVLGQQFYPDIARRYGGSKDAVARHEPHVSRSKVVAARREAGSTSA